jgi:hypothetical protein
MDTGMPASAEVVLSLSRAVSAALAAAIAVDS